MTRREINETLTCVDCSRKAVFTGKGVTEFLKAMDLAGCRDALEAGPHSRKALCPACYRKRQQEKHG